MVAALALAHCLTWPSLLAVSCRRVGCSPTALVETVPTLAPRFRRFPFPRFVLPVRSDIVVSFCHKPFDLLASHALAVDSVGLVCTSRMEIKVGGNAVKSPFWKRDVDLAVLERGRGIFHELGQGTRTPTEQKNVNGKLVIGMFLRHSVCSNDCRNHWGYRALRAKSPSATRFADGRRDPAAGLLNGVAAKPPRESRL